ncbi:MAG: type II toxin-antitoxin system PemK/MazF family toxin [Cyanobacteria bacterium P01_F01_bin.4]
MNRSLQKGDIVLVSLPKHTPSMHEQQGIRPAVIVGIPPGETRYLLVFVAPLTTQIGKWVEMNPTIYPVLPSGIGNLTQTSVVLLDQIRAVDVQRIVRYLGSLSEEDYSPIAVGIGQIFM